MTSTGNNVHDCPKEIVRPLGNFSPSLWGDTFGSFVWDSQVSDMYAEEIEVLKKDVKNMLLAACSSTEKIKLIDIVERLGLSYHFETEIEEYLQQLFNSFTDSEDEKQSDLCTLAIQFRIFRQHGYNATSGVFNKFKDANGKFMEAIKNDAKGLLNLYEAAYLRRHGEDILEEALAFATGHLKRMVPHLSSPLAKQVAHALEQSLHRGCPRIEAHYFISIYEEDEYRNEILLRLAKLDYNLLQMLHKKELSDIIRWWKKLDLVGKLIYPRDRVVECYFWALGLYFEPQYSVARIMAAKTIAMTSIIDDTYDAYGTLDELEVFTDAVERWNTSEIDRLPSYMKICYIALLNLYDEFGEELKKQGRYFAVDNARERMKQLINSYHIEAKWFIEGYVPPFNEYMENALITSTYLMLMPSSLLGIESATKEAFEWLMNNPTIVAASAIISRSIDDVATYKDEKERGQVATGIECYMKEHGVSKEVAFDKFHEMAENAWKDMNEECLRTSLIAKHILMRAINQARLIEVAYKNDEDGYTHPEKVLKPHILSLLVDPFII